MKCDTECDYCADGENQADENEDDVDDDDDDDERCRGQMLTKRVATARPDARIQQASDISLIRISKQSFLYDQPSPNLDADGGSCMYQSMTRGLSQVSRQEFPS